MPVLRRVGRVGSVWAGGIFAGRKDGMNPKWWAVFACFCFVVNAIEEAIKQPDPFVSGFLAVSAAVWAYLTIRLARSKVVP